ncbi:hypothetical protein HAL013_01960 [Helicobacter ailurogastricus]|uniref:Uncharacterized protein n=1 Tax=Helicobacter ailurogastricus TaxID=1578720 RepID=A0A0K2X360_9HELI|nr:hypothetical protein HAL011_11290 [Helicobacter ailurogastricus]CRF42047.1 hypothetical protein HAL013_01960 [Helicobacter ailurogastricus]CRF43586.1 hypothetical protein HAL09_01320 [Helicobacter ailurogastricus]
MTHRWQGVKNNKMKSKISKPKPTLKRGLAVRGLPINWGLIVV